jgi:hypothetical protein
MSEPALPSCSGNTGVSFTQIAHFRAYKDEEDRGRVAENPRPAFYSEWCDESTAQISYARFEASYSEGVRCKSRS